MNKSNKVESVIGALRERFPGLSAAAQRVSSSLDHGTVQYGIMASTCELTGARCGMITTMDEPGRPQGFVTAGWSPDEERLLMESFPRALLRPPCDFPGPLRLAHLRTYIRSICYGPDPVVH